MIQANVQGMEQGQTEVQDQDTNAKTRIIIAVGVTISVVVALAIGTTLVVRSRWSKEEASRQEKMLQEKREADQRTFYNATKDTYFSL